MELFSACMDTDCIIFGTVANLATIESRLPGRTRSKGESTAMVCSWCLKLAYNLFNHTFFPNQVQTFGKVLQVINLLNCKLYKIDAWIGST